MADLAIRLSSRVARTQLDQKCDGLSKDCSPQTGARTPRRPPRPAARRKSRLDSRRLWPTRALLAGGLTASRVHRAPPGARGVRVSTRPLWSATAARLLCGAVATRVRAATSRPFPRQRAPAATAAMDAPSGARHLRARGHPSAPSCGARAPTAPWARFSAWLECVCVVTFDLELGQALEVS
ncbi:Protein DENND6B [Galemys pyrenaicus]|uniref:Protein DENND6B n=1 Tax=Galemys pyrenaicus TaxID=202257 RepID=A0A8J6AA96_GALPY|nr:Protein DENND6B [Galemys pyrenaicus]